jgi:hypothetical protein
VREKNPQVSASFVGADDGIRTRDPHLGKVAKMVLLTCGEAARAPLSRDFATHHLSSFPAVFRSVTGEGREARQAWRGDHASELFTLNEIGPLSIVTGIPSCRWPPLRHDLEAIWL